MKNQIITFLFFWLGQIAFFIFNFVSSQQLDVVEYGIYNIVLAVIMFGMRFMEVGIGDYYLIKGNENGLKTIFIINLVKGLIISIIFLLSSFFFNDFYNSDHLFGLIITCSLIFIIEPLKNPMIYKLYKEKKLVPIIIIERGTYLLSSIIGIFLVLYFKSVWVLVWVYLFYFIVQSILSYLVLPIFPFSNFDKIYAKEIITFSKHIIGFILIGYAIRQGLDLIIPKLIGFPQFAIYSFTFLIGVSPINFLIYPLNKLIYPVYASELTNNSLDSLVNKVFIKTFYLIVFLTLTVYYSSPIILEVMEHTKLLDHDLLLLMLIYCLFRGLAANLGTIFKVLNKQKAYNNILVIEAIIIFILLIFLNQTPTQIIIALILAIFTHLTLGLIVLNNFVKLKPKKIIISLVIGLLLVFIELFLSLNLGFEISLAIFNLIVFSLLLVNFLLSLKHYFIKS